MAQLDVSAFSKHTSEKLLYFLNRPYLPANKSYSNIVFMGWIWLKKQKKQRQQYVFVCVKIESNNLRIQDYLEEEE